MLHVRQKQALRLLLVQLVLIVVNTGVFAAVWYCYFADRLDKPFYAKGDYAVIFLFMVVYTLLARLYGGFALTISRITELIYSQCVALLLAYGMMYVVAGLLMRVWPNPLPLLLAWAVSCVAAFVWARPANRASNRICPPARTILVYLNEDAHKNGKAIIRSLSWRFDLVEELSAARPTEELCEEILRSGVEMVMLCGIGSSQRNDLLKFCLMHDIRCMVRPNIGDFMMNSAPILQMHNLPVMMCQRSTPSVIYAAGKRLADLVLGLAGLVIASPFMLAAALAIKLYDGGPVLFRQTRLTKDGRRFEILKFRSMRVDAEKDGVARLAAKADDRITPVGRVIRACRIDELPQIINILRGDMSLVGPRPERPEIAAQYEAIIPEFSLRLQVKAGLTGYAQVYGKYNTEPYDKLQMDLMYIAQQGFVTDLKILFATIKILFVPESTEGVDQGQTTAIESGEEAGEQ